jgi:hypothetical protein
MSLANMNRRTIMSDTMAVSKTVELRDSESLKSLVANLGLQVLGAVETGPKVEYAVVGRGNAAGLAVLRRIALQVSVNGAPAQRLVVQEPNTWVYPHQVGFAPVWWGDTLLAFVARDGTVITRKDSAAFDALLSR